ncbi:PREDICTED: kinesin-like protein KIN-10C [Nicotiana attenuata]|uniref:Kinesin-like protein kin-5b n=1 Tax=Nicotiana attenuata TaxID=49451 RepID=A0A314KVR3_NICAT|nr:PREDICTED: kinesin-like protein KIN-10C [Nicotiana attenuata]OIT33352.1 kinesin-like protein kin-5b [Nicotiana attenuata]
MALSTPDSNRFKLPIAGPRISRRVRIVGKIRGFIDQESEISGRDLKPWVTVCRHIESDSDPGKVTISFGDEGSSRKDRYELDNCYEQDEDNAVVFSREVKPLIAEVLNGRNASIIAYGARGSGKTHTIQGSVDKEGLAAMAIAEILSQTKDAQKAVLVSFYEVFQDHVYDLLDPNHPEVQVLEDSQGKIKLKGLSKAAVDSISHFHDLSACLAAPCYPVQKTPLQIPKRSHKGLMIHIASADDIQGSKCLNVMNFVDLAGYEDSRRSSKDGVTLTESARINKSLYGIMNVVYALNTNEKRVPYRESKLTRMLQESLGGSSHVLLLTCLNPSLCQDTLYVASLASRSCQSAGQILTSSTMKSKKHTNQQARLVGTPLSGKKNNSASNLIGRKLFSDRKAIISKQDDVTSATKFKPLSENVSTIISSFHKKTSQDKSNSDSSRALISSAENEIPSAFKETISIHKMEKDASPPNKAKDLKVTPEVHCDVKEILSFAHDGVVDTEKKSGDMNIDKVASPPLSERLREITNNLRLLESSTSLHMLMPKQLDTSQGSLESSGDIIEPKTPTAETDMRTGDKLEIAMYTSPWERFHTRSSGVKNCLVQEYLNLLNTASKEELTRIQGIGEKRATYILELREESSEPFKSLEDLKEVGLSKKEINGLMRRMAGQLFC